MEPTDKDSYEWKEWFVRHRFGATTAISITMADVEELDVLMDFVRNVYQKKNATPSGDPIDFKRQD